MRIKYTAIPNVVNSNSDTPAAPWASAGVTERPKQETPKQTEPNKKDKKKSDRALDWLRRSR